MPNYVQYIVANKGLGMSPGKLAAQVAHAAVKGYEISLKNDLNAGPRAESPIHAWNRTGHTKIVLEARDTEHLTALREYAKSRGYESWLVIDEGRTEVAPHTPTALGFPILDKQDEEVAFTFSALKTYKGKNEVYKLYYRERRWWERGPKWVEIADPME